MLWTDKKEPILEFRGKHNFLSNFSNYSLRMFAGNKSVIDFPTSEHAFQAFKTEDEDEFAKIANAETASMAKKLGKKCSIRENWDDVKDAVMYSVLMHKFSEYNPDLTRDLIRTYPAYLQEGNDWGDTYWGCCYFKPEQKWVGENKLGQLLMIVRFQRMMEEILIKGD